MHRSAPPGRATVRFAVNLEHHGTEIAAFGQIVRVRPMTTHHAVFATQDGANTECRRLLSDAQVHRATHLPLGVSLGDLLLHHANAEKITIKQNAGIHQIIAGRG
jgi:hypothetical protein